MALFRYTAVIVNNKGVQEINGVTDAPDIKAVFNKFSNLYGVTIRDVRPATVEDIKLWNLKKFRGALRGDTQTVSEETKDNQRSNRDTENPSFWTFLTILVMAIVIVFMGVYIIKR